MDSKEKAKELVEKYLGTQRGFVIPMIIAKQCALIAVDEILKECHSDRDDFWYKVKQEICDL
jgi:hypothetical protein